MWREWSMKNYPVCAGTGGNCFERVWWDGAEGGSGGAGLESIRTGGAGGSLRCVSAVRASSLRRLLCTRSCITRLTCFWIFGSCRYSCEMPARSYRLWSTSNRFKSFNVYNENNNNDPIQWRIYLIETLQQKKMTNKFLFISLKKIISSDLNDRSTCPKGAEKSVENHWGERTTDI